MRQHASKGDNALECVINELQASDKPSDIFVPEPFTLKRKISRLFSADCWNDISLFSSVKRSFITAHLDVTFLIDRIMLAFGNFLTDSGSEPCFPVITTDGTLLFRMDATELISEKVMVVSDVNDFFKESIIDVFSKKAMIIQLLASLNVQSIVVTSSLRGTVYPQTTNFLQALLEKSASTHLWFKAGLSFIVTGFIGVRIVKRVFLKEPEVQTETYYTIRCFTWSSLDFALETARGRFIVDDVDTFKITSTRDSESMSIVVEDIAVSSSHNTKNRAQLLDVKKFRDVQELVRHGCMLQDVLKSVSCVECLLHFKTAECCSPALILTNSIVRKI
jgi:hypothetical protein